MPGSVGGMFECFLVFMSPSRCLFQNDTSNSTQLLESGIIPLLVFMASKATQLSRQWILKDLEVGCILFSCCLFVCLLVFSQIYLHLFKIIYLKENNVMREY